MNQWLRVSVAAQKLFLMEGNRRLQTYSVSTAKNGVGEVIHSEQTPRGWHAIHAKIGADCPVNSVFVERIPTGEIYSEQLALAHPERDWILTRIMTLTGLEPGKNQGGMVDTLKRFVYIHGAPDSAKMGIPGSHGCIRMANKDILALFELVEPNMKVFIDEH